MRHEETKNEPVVNNINGRNKENEHEKEEELDVEPIYIESMSKAKHSNMETTGESDMVDNFRQNLKFKLDNDLHTKRSDNNDIQKPEDDQNQNNNEMTDIEDKPKENIDLVEDDGNEKK
jgi:hypothetical protein